MRIHVLPLVILGIVAVSVAASVALSARDHAWIFTTLKGAPLAEEQVYWWLVFLPLGLGGALISSITSIAALRSLRRREPLLAASALSIGVLGVIALAAALNFGNRWVVLRGHSSAPQKPESRFDVFLPEQWSELALRLAPGKALTSLRSDGVGVQGHPGIIPFDAFLLKRVTFVGLRPEQVDDALGPPLPQRHAWGVSPSYAMGRGPRGMSGSLYLYWGRDERDRPSVVAESLVFHHPEPVGRAPLGDAGDR